ncbi:MAG TPA: SRPBCC family protein [Thermoanaerobaculia bacterium]|nr:SRPBCC family protein [Thermoanaerobaculia bacterium]
MDERSSREIVVTRVFDAPRPLVFQMWTEAEHLANWWGPNGFTITTNEFDFREGGAWRFVMHGPDGTDYRNEIVYRTIDAPNRIAYSHTSGPLFEAESTFEDRDGKTAVTVRMTFATAELRDRVVADHNAVEGLSQTLGRLGEQVAEAFTFTRTLDAPRELVFRVWTEAEHLEQWFGPKGFEMFHCTSDLRPGGVMHYGMRGPDGTEMWGRWIWREITPPERIVFVQSFSDAQGGVTRAPFLDGGWPLETLSTITLTEDRGKTTVSMVGVPIHATDAERATFRGMHDSMNGGWSGTFAQLTAYLEKAQS